MDISLEGRVNNIPLPESKSLFPLFEAVINSIHAIEDRKISNGFIDITLIREDYQSGLIDHGNFAKVVGLSVIDNGIGFNSDNFQSFSTSDSLYKKSRGSKGIGRFLWLKAFADIHIESIFSKNGFYKRNLEFNFQHNGVKQISCISLSDEDCQNFTKIDFLNFLPPYRDNFPQKVETIGRRILEHCISYFVLGKAPRINVIDGNNNFDINDYFFKYLEAFSNSYSINIKNNEFTVTGIKYYNSSDLKHTLYYCANHRTVISHQLHKLIPNLLENSKIEDYENGKKFVYLAFVSSKFFDENVNQERLGFNNIIEVHEGLSEQLGLISYQEIREKLVTLLSQELSPYLEKIQENKLQEIQKYIVHEAIQYRPLLKYAKEDLASIKPGLSSEKLDTELYKIKSRLELSLKQQSEEILSEPIENFDKFPIYRQEYHKFLEKYNDFGINKLAEYVVHRKIIIELFTKHLERNDENRYSLESEIHEIIFPMRATSDDINSFQKQNLWIIDERLSYHYHLSSDIPLNKLPDPLRVDSSSRPDIIIFNNPILLVDTQNTPYSSITIVEFKRPMRKDYDKEDENPISQVSSYISKIRANNLEDRNGRLIRVTPTTPFYVYVICDLTSNVRDILENTFGYIITPDQDGYFNFNKNTNAYIEVLSFDKVIKDAKLRNKILFDKLGI
ncbi:hypothetical protein FJR11_16715 [Anabaena sp. UHCC 0187]|uniref:ATP-binding protein n=1 Tax=Anabaena sp. UHCC 0187 TaxID=2590018 RepID=UPI0014487F89|nr:ATP-binding protein [Anabaena sp. UHCC 0187]MTJ14193.1 hypothetical protein [Anabaena sp. UHCC 0187]